MPGIGGYSVAWAYSAPVLGAVFDWVTENLLAPALVAVVFSGLTAFLMEKWKTQRDQLTRICDTLRTDLYTLQQLSGEYWGSKGSNPLAEARIMALQTEVLETLTVLKNEFSFEVVSENQVTDLMDAVSGGNFKALYRRRDPERLLKSSVAISAVRLALVRARTQRARQKGS